MSYIHEWLLNLTSKVVYYMAKLTDSLPPKVKYVNFCHEKHENYSLSKRIKIFYPVITGNTASGNPFNLIYVVGT